MRKSYLTSNWEKSYLTSNWERQHLIDRQVKVTKNLRRGGAVVKRRVTVGSVELPQRSPSFKAELPAAADSAGAAEIAELPESAEKRSRVSTIKSLFKERRKTFIDFNLSPTTDKVYTFFTTNCQEFHKFSKFLIHQTGRFSYVKWLINYHDFS